MIFHYDEVVNFDTIANSQTDMIFHYDVVATFDSIDNVQIDMISHPDEACVYVWREIETCAFKGKR